MLNDISVIVPAAGKGTRFAPFTMVVPKELLPIMQYPAIDFIAKECINSGAKKVIYVINKEKKMIVDYVQKVVQQPNIELVYQATPLGLGHAVLQAEQHIKQPIEPFVFSNTVLFGQNEAITKEISQKESYYAIILPDDIIFSQTPALEQLSIVSKKYNASVVAVKKIAKEQSSSYGMIAIDQKITETIFSIKSVVEKPSLQKAPSEYAIIGRYILDCSIFEHLKNITPGIKGEYQLTDAIHLLIQSEKPVLALAFEGKHFDIGTPQGWRNAVNHYAENEQ